MSVSTQPPPVVSEPVREATEAEDFERIACRDCGLWFPAGDGLALHFALKGPCPDCGGSFQLAPAPASRRLPLSL